MNARRRKKGLHAGRKPSNRHRVPDPYLVQALRELGSALAAADGNGVVPHVEAMALRGRCRSYAWRLNGYGWWDFLPFGSFVMRLIHPALVRRTLPKVHRHVDRCIEFLQAGVDAEAAALTHDGPFEDRVAATIKLLNLSISRDDPSS